LTLPQYLAGSHIITNQLLTIIQDQYRLPWNGIHGYAHWIRVRENGLKVAEQSGANPSIVELFAFLHDSQRRNESFDPGHGKRAAKFISTLPDSMIPLGQAEIELLKYACAYHTNGLIKADITVQTCWDADRLDLGRVNIFPKPQLLCTLAAKNPTIIEWAVKRSQGKLSNTT
jgi:uncharacterized protein